MAKIDPYKYVCTICGHTPVASVVIDNDRLIAGYLCNVCAEKLHLTTQTMSYRSPLKEILLAIDDRSTHAPPAAGPWQDGKPPKSMLGQVVLVKLKNGTILVTKVQQIYRWDFVDPIVSWAKINGQKKPYAGNGDGNAYYLRARVRESVSKPT